MSSLAVVASGAIITGAGLALTALPAAAATTSGTATHDAHPHPRGVTAKPLTRTQLQQVHVRQSRMLEQSRTAPAFRKAAAKTFTVNTTQDTPLANPAGTRCLDAAGKCSLRAAVDAANNRLVPVRVLLGKHTYTLSSATELTVTNPAGTSIVGQGSSKTVIKGAGSRVFYVDGLTGSAGGLLYLSDAKVTGGTSSDGAGIYLYENSGAPSLVLDGVVVSGNTATGSGGALYADAYNSVYATNTRFVNNVAANGGAMYSDWSNLAFRNVTMTGNHTAVGASGDGGALYNYYGVIRMQGGSISDNTAGDAANAGDGGGIWDEYGNISLTGVHLDRNTANSSGQGGALYVYFDLISVEGGTMSQNHAHGTYSSGGALYMEEGAQVDLHRLTMKGNRMDAPYGDGYGGGAIFDAAEYYANQLTIDRSSITGSNGSAVYAEAYSGEADLSITRSTLSGNHNNAHNGMDGYGCGGAVCAYNDEYAGVNLTMSGNKVEHNSGVGDYGAGAVMVYGYYYGGTTVVLRGNLFASNVAGAGGYGGAVGVYNDDEYNAISVRSQSNRFVANTAGTSADEGYGGALSLYYYATLTDHGSTFSKNVAVGDGAYGGAVSNQSYQSARFTGTRFTGNRAGQKGSGEGYGGALYTEDEAGTTLTAVTMSGNRAASYGGGLYADDYGTSIDRSTISGNTAGTSHSAGYGGGIYNEGPMAIDNSTIANNRVLSVSGTPGQGGGVFQDEAPFDIRYTTVSGNLAKQGGGLYLGAQGGNVVSSIVAGNRKSTHGSESDCTTGSSAYRLHSLGGNVVGQQACVVATQGSDKVTKHPGLKKLAHNGGPTETMALSAKSPAVGRATFQVPSTDQRGHKRPSRHADAGAFELPKKH